MRYPVSSILNFLIYIIARSLHASYRYRYVGIENLKKAADLGPNGSYLLAVWHQNLLHATLAQTGRQYVVMASRSKDGNPVAYTIKKLGHYCFRGSSKKNGVDKGGSEAKEDIIKILKKGLPGALTIDGPKGPAGVVKPGIIDMSKKSGSPIVPYTVLAQNFKEFNSWDKFHLALPFSKILVFYGTPMVVDSNISNEEFTQKQIVLKEILDNDEKKAQAEFARWNTYPKNTFLKNSNKKLNLLAD